MNKLPTGSLTGWLNKVPEVALSFWIIKIMSTTVGETGADFLAVNAGLGQGVTRTVMAALLAAALFVQLRTRRYTPWIYWLTVVLVSVVGTQITDLLTDGLGVSLYISTSVFAVALAAIFFVTGILRLISAFQHRLFREWFWLVLSSAISILMGVLIMNGYPQSSLWLPGMLIAIELLLQGWSLLFMGLAARSLTK